MKSSDIRRLFLVAIFIALATSLHAAGDAPATPAPDLSARRTVIAAYFLLFLGAGVWLPYFPLFLSHLGFAGWVVAQKLIRQTNCAERKADCIADVTLTGNGQLATSSAQVRHQHGRGIHSQS